MREVRLADECPTIGHHFFLTGGDEEEFDQVLVAAFAGQYRDGSSGNSDATYMHGLLSLACQLWPHRGLVIDLSGLSYEFGDQILMVLAHPFGFPSALVVGPGCEAALATLITEECPATPVADLEWVFDTVDDAVNHVARQEPEISRLSRPV